MTSLTEIYGEVISGYSRAQAIEDGQLVDVSDRTRRAFRFPVALTRAVYTDCVEWPEDDMQAMQDQTGRLSDVIWMARCAIRRVSEADGPADRVPVFLYRIPRDGHSTEPQLVELVAVCGPGDDMEPVITIQFPGED